jgi:hypothetical protein
MQQIVSQEIGFMIFVPGVQARECVRYQGPSSALVGRIRCNILAQNILLVLQNKLAVRHETGIIVCKSYI